MVSDVSAMEVASTTLRRPGRGRLDGAVLFGTVEGAEQRHDVDRRVPDGGRQQFGRAADLGGAGEEDQRRAALLGESAAHCAGDLVLQPRGGIAADMARHDGKGAPSALHHRRPADQGGNAGAVEGRRHDEDAQVVPQGALGIERQREAEISVEAALVELVEEDGGDTLERRIVEDHAGEDALGDDLDTRARRHLRAKAHPQAHPSANLLAECLGHPVRHRARRDAPRLEHEDLACPRPGFLHQHQRHTRRFTGARRRNQDGARRPRKGLAEGGQCRIDGQVGPGHAGRLRFLHRIRKRRGGFGPKWIERASGLRRVRQGHRLFHRGTHDVHRRDVDASRHDTPGTAAAIRAAPPGGGAAGPQCSSGRQGAAVRIMRAAASRPGTAPERHATEPLANRPPPWLWSASRCGRSSMVERQLPKLHTRVRFPSPAPKTS